MPRSRQPIAVEDLISPALPLSTEVQRAVRGTGKLATLINLLQAPDGATIATLCEATGWLSHSVRGAMAGTLKRKGIAVISEKPANGLHRYRIGGAA